MPIRPFPFELNIGTDVAHVSRIKNLLVKDAAQPKNLVGFLKRVLTRRERVQFWSRYGSFDLQDPKAARAVHQFLAGRFAAKEAAIKAISQRRLSFHDVVIRTPLFGEPMSAVILDKTSADDRPIKHEVELLQKAKPINPATQEKRHGLSPLAFENAWPSKQSTTESTQQAAVPEAPCRDEEAADVEEATEDEVELLGTVAKLSISHDGDYATAVCLAAEEPQEGDVGGEAAARGYMISTDEAPKWQG
ncbi:uncharacterized protein LTR77_010810 [Saxophila tyrrhenica]|uniref:4'-phosphopantetheinyl transferase domain-containing protein n=1 Tax=Saxophila tyrrhenica TaxID=1690608 RepID=A0AAV9NV70_9PEZI|nr:hypothetical protein LTR77_010810 [Saxophila tyrrhenica]